jgi:cell division transport system ATP-binding protein
MPLTILVIPTDAPPLVFDACYFLRGEQPILSDITMTLEMGEFYWVKGNSGAGKSTLLELAYGALLPTTGYVSTFGRLWEGMGHDVRAYHRRHIGVIFQDYRLLMHLSVAENVGLPLYIQGVSRDRITRQVKELLDWVGLKDRLNAMPDSLSGGERQRIAIARAVITRPKLILADEPTGNVDKHMARRLMFLFEELKRLGTTVVIATHDMGLIEEFKHPTVQLNNGRILMEKTQHVSVG